MPNMGDLLAFKVDAPADVGGAFQQGYLDQEKVKQAPYETEKLKWDHQKSQIEALGGLLGSAQDQATWDSARAKAQSLGFDVSKEPAVYDPNYVKQQQMVLLSAKDRITLEQSKYDREFENKKFEETQRHNKASEGMFGNSTEGRAMNILLGGNQDDPAYALAVNKLTQPKLQPVVQADGSTQLVAVTPELPAQFRAPNPQALVGQSGVVPPPMRGTPDTTPTTPANQLLAPPQGMPNPQTPVRSFNVSPIAGTQGAPKLTDDQTKAAGFTDRTVAAHNIINQLETDGYTPSVVTDELGDSKIGNTMLTSQGQQFVQAKRDFVNAILRRESGAAISQSEFDNANKQYFPQKGDRKDVIAQKRQNRELAIESLKRSAGPALKGSTGTPANQSVIPHDAIDEELRKRGVK